ncbi:MAG: efflux RND transporter periplasmic adaptor subunit [Candidatus Omnitrophica bacterium]|nr:efflux RND transporter periplasmic adaptor subunit [Candidatus Omnitrophota bacterium]
MRKNVVLMIMVLAAGFLAGGGGFLGGTVALAAEAQARGAYYCPMHPQITSDRKGSCSICGMDLIKNEPEPEMTAPATEQTARKILYYRNPMNPAVTSPVPTKDSMGMDYVPVYEEPQGAPQGVPVNESKQQLIGVKKALVQKRPLTVEILSVGKVAYDPELYVAQEEYVQALKAVAATRDSALMAIREQSAGLLAAAEKKLMQSGMSQAEISALKKSGAAQDGLYSAGNSGKAWVYITVYEYELGLVKEGQKVAVNTEAYPGEVFPGQIVALTPVVNAESRSLRVRSEVADPAGKLKPEMFVNAKLVIDLGEKLAVPAEAVMDSGLRKIVYVVKNDRFAAREVVLGPKAGEYYEVLSGVNEGEAVVTSGNFLIDAESKLKGSI